MKWLHLFGLMALIFSSMANAFTEKEVIEWGSQVMEKTLSASYLDTPTDIANNRKNYMLAAWGPMLDFFSDKRAYIQKHQLILKPKDISKAKLLDQGTCHGLPCWRINQSFLIPELKFKIDMYLLITTEGPRGGEQTLVVQSMEFTLHEEP